MARLLTRMDEASALERLVVLARGGERAAGDALVRAFAGEVYGVLFRIVGNHEDAEDLAQEVFVRALSALDLYRGDGPFGGWLLRIAVHVGRDHLRRRGRAPVLLGLTGIAAGDGRPEPGAALEHGELTAHLAAALERLPAPLRAALALRVLEGREYDEVAAALGVRPATARTQVMRARRLLERLLAPWLGARHGRDTR
jgi:RNA polymerase sigma-70 factor (ECF subfamily)